MPVTTEEIEVAEPEIDESNSSMVQMMIGGKLYDAKNVVQCKVCQSPHRMFIESEIIKGTYYTVIAELVGNRDNEGRLGHPSVNSLSNHMKKGHAPIKHVMHRRLMERIHEEQGHDLSEDIDTMVDKVVLAHAVVNRAHERLVANEIEPTLSDAAQFARLLEEFERRNDTAGISEAIWREAVYAYMEILAPEIPAERREAVSRKLEAHPTLRALAEALEQRREETVQGEVER